MAMYPRWGGRGDREFPWIDEETIRWHISRGDVWVGGRRENGRFGVQYLGGRLCLDPDYRIKSRNDFFFCPIETPSDMI